MPEQIMGTPMSTDQQPNLSSAVGIQFSAALSALGQDAAALQNALTQDESTLSARTDLIAGRSVWVGAYPQALSSDVPAELQDAGSRNLRFALTALAKIEADVRAYTAQFPKQRLAVVIGTSTSGIADNESMLKARFQQQSSTPVLHQKQEMGSLAKALQAHLGWEGAAYTISTACSSAAKAMAAGQRLLNADLADAVLVGGVDTLCKLTLNGFDSLESLSSSICQPCGASRDGINIGEAAGLFLLSKAPAPVMLLSSGESMDAWHISAPHPEGQGAAEAMQQALNAAGLSAADIGYLNLHGTSTPQNDAMEIKAVQSVFVDVHVPLSSTKHKTGHCLGAAGAIEAYICQQVLLDQSWLPLHHAGELDSALADQHYVRDSRLPQPMRYAMSNSFAFGGSNISLILGRVLP
ncbi:beta-ketoacyl-[acyl-carrier-protein] synthase family protein [Acinetobacter sp.]|uniref:beta-ketoacyl-[acyl-carrier-protein] synthase family protein n=1 Tax=Acinetobacter sp. TaxID=472 RepID=UPI0035AE77FA